MQVIRVGDTQFVVAKTSESLFILGMEEGSYERPWCNIAIYGSFNHYDMAISVNHGFKINWTEIGYGYDCWLMAYGSSREMFDNLGTGSGYSHYKNNKNLQDIYNCSRYGTSFNTAKDAMIINVDKDKAPDRYKAKKDIIDVLTPLLSHFPYQYRDVPGVRIVLNNDNKNLTPEEIIAHAVTTNISLLTIGIIRVSWSNDNEGLTGTYKYKFKTHRECFDEFVKTMRKIKKPVEDIGGKVSVGLGHIHINDDPKDTGIPALREMEGYESVDSVLKKIDHTVSTTTDSIRKLFTDITSGTVVSYKTIYVTGWEIVAGYQSLKCTSCMVGMLEDHDNYMVEAYAHSGSCTLALFIHTDQEDAVRQHLSDIATKCERGISPADVHDWYHPGIVARSMVWKFQNHTGKWHDRLYWNCDLPGRKSTTVCALFLSAMKADDIKQYRAHPHGDVLEDAELILTPSSGDWGDDLVGIPYMDSFDCGYLKSNGDVRCFTSYAFAKERGAPKGALFELKCSSGLQVVKEQYSCPVCDSPADDLTSIHLYDGGYTDMCESCAEDYRPLDRSVYGRDIWALSDECFYCESTDTYFMDGDDVPNHVNIDGDWYHESSYEVAEYLKSQEKEDNEPEMVSAIYDPDDLRRRAQYPITDCMLDYPRKLYVLSSIWDRYQERRNEEAALVIHNTPDPQLPNSRELINRIAQLGAVRLRGDLNCYYWSPAQVVTASDMWSSTFESNQPTQETV